MKTNLLLLALFGLMPLVLFSCKQSPEPTSEDETIYQMILNDQFFFYQNNNVVLNAAGNSPHGNFKLLFNQTAWDALDSTGKLPVGGTFPNGSLVLKDVVRNGSTSFYAAMLKQPSSANATEGWLWYEAELNGDLIIGVSSKGNGCIGCHRGNNNRDFTNSFDLH